jgi:RNA polymerase sigma factor, sigma-70 family
LIFLFVFSEEEERDKFEYIYNKYKRLMFHKAYPILQNHALTEDAVSEAFIRVYKNLDKIDDPDSNMSIAFLMTIVKNVALTFVKREQKWNYDEITEEKESGINIESSILDEISASEIVKLIDELNDDLKSVFILKYAHELSHKEIADTLGITENNVTVRLHRAKKKLSILLEKEGYVNE